MKCLSARVVLAGVSFLLPFGALSSSSEAGVIPWVYNAIFGPSHGPYGYSNYGPVYYGAGYGGGCCGTPVMAYRPSYPCCDPCAVPCGPCGVAVAGSCGVPQCTPAGKPVAAPGSPAPATTPNNSGTPKTYAEPDKFEKPTGASATSDPNNTAPTSPTHESDPGFRKARPAPTIPSDNEERESLKPANPPASNEPSADEKPNLKAPAATPRINDGDEGGTEVKPASRTSQRIAWAPVLQRRQAATQTRHGTAYVVRLPAYPKLDELKQPGTGTAIAKK